MDKIIIIGGGKHANILADIIKNFYKEIRLYGYVDVKKTTLQSTFIKENHKDIANLRNKGVKHFIVGVGNNLLREKLFEKYIEEGFSPFTLAGPNSYISSTAEIGSGSILMPNCSIQTNAKIGKNCIINTGASIDHDCIIGDNVHIAPGTVLSGSVLVGKNTLIGTGSSIRDGVKIGENCIIAVGSAVIKDIPDNSKYGGVPAKKIE